MSTTEEFQDYKTRPTELVGRWVKYETRYATGILKISRVTPTQIILVNGTKLRFDGRKIGDTSAWSKTDYELLTEQGLIDARKAIAEAKEQRELTLWLDEMARSRQPLTVLRAMKAAADEVSSRNAK